MNSVPVDTAPHSDLDTRVNEVVLSAMIGDYRAMRGTGRSETTRDRAAAEATDRLVSGYQSARARHDAQRAADGGINPSRPLIRVTDRQRTDLARVGTVLNGRFVLDKLLGEGGMGMVFRAVDRRRLEARHSQPYVAIKVLTAAFAGDSRAFRTLEAEARKVQMLSHPNIVHIFDFDRDHANAFLVMEYLQGRDLFGVLQDKTTLPFKLVERIFTDVMEALAFAHGRDVIHCDIKPSNVFLLEDGRVKLLDFGIATAAGLPGFDAADLGSYTAAYASPEVLNGRAHKAADDVYALACVIYETLAGRHPFDHRSALEAMDLGLRPARIDTIPGHAATALQVALSFDASERFQTIAAFRQKLFRRSVISRVFSRGPDA